MPFVLRHNFDVDRLRPLRALAGLVRDTGTLSERLVAGTSDVAVMHEHVLRPVGRGNEAVPLRIVEPLHGSFRHENTSLYDSRTPREGAQTRRPDSL